MILRSDHVLCKQACKYVHYALTILSHVFVLYNPSKEVFPVIVEHEPLFAEDIVKGPVWIFHPADTPHRHCRMECNTYAVLISFLRCIGFIQVEY